MLDAADLSDDVAALNAMLIAAQARETAKDVAIASKDEHMHLSDILNATRQYIKVLNPPHSAETIMNKAGVALQAIEKESEVNRLRARRYGLIQRIERIAEEAEAQKQAATEAAKT